MASFKPLIGTFLFILVIGLFLNVFVAPNVDATSPVSTSVLYGFADAVENGWSINVPVIGSVSVNPISWFWLGIDGVTDKVVEQLNIMTYIPDSISIIIIILSILGLAFSVATLVRGN